jgi:hypothetical protein
MLGTRYGGLGGRISALSGSIDAEGRHCRLGPVDPAAIEQEVVATAERPQVRRIVVPGVAVQMRDIEPALAVADAA